MYVCVFISVKIEVGGVTVIAAVEGQRGCNRGQETCMCMCVRACVCI